MEYSFKEAHLSDAEQIWAILQEAIRRRKEDGSKQWQDGYPNLQVVMNDIERGAGYVLTEQDRIIGYCAAFINDEPEYAKIEGRWLSDDDFVVVHRVAVAESHLGKGLAKRMFEFVEELAVRNKIFSIKVDTNFDNPAMIKSFERMGYVYCGQVYFRGSARRAYEKVLGK